jgi:hypothetical protein
VFGRPEQPIISIVFIVAVVVTVLYLSVTRAESFPVHRRAGARTERGGLWQTIVVVGLLSFGGAG